ncbi:MAG: energy transducer TonB [Alphaproteobacteria bacterium]|nr:energy transducer TonB [Alphaproteobacteria bacterium]
MSDTSLPGFGGALGGWPNDAQSKRRWTACLGLVLALHAALVLVLLTRQAAPPPAEPPPAMLIELAPAAAAPPIPAPSPPPPPAASEPPKIETPPPPLAAPKSAVVLPRKPAKPKPPPRQVERPLPEPQQPAPVAAMPPPRAAPAPAAPPAPTPAPAPVSGDVVAGFRSRLLAHLQRYKEYPRSAQERQEQGTVVLHFTMDRDGRVLSYRVERSSGSADLDAAVETMIQRAQPLPSIPPEMPGQLELSVPVHFALR